jgi:MoxR-like ATPase
VTSDGFTHALEKPFFLIATQNPIEMAGTFPLPEAQLDRFLVSMNLGYPSFEDEINILEREEHSDPLELIQPVAELSDILALQAAARAVDVVRPLKAYMIQLVTATRIHPDIVVGVSPRGGVALQRCAQAIALIRGRSFVTPDDIKTAAPAVLSHRLLTRDRQSDTAQTVIAQVLNDAVVPVE